MTHLIRTAAFLSIIGTIASVHAWDEAESGAVGAASPPVTSTDEGRSIYTLPTLSKLWEAQAVMNVHRDKVSHFKNDEDAIYVQSSAGTVTVLNSESGLEFWSAQVGRNDEIALSGASDSQMVTIVVGPTIHAFDKFSGQKLFAYRLQLQPTGTPLLTRRAVMVGNNLNVTRTIYVCVLDGSLLAYDVDNLLYLGQHGQLKRGVSQALDWKFGPGEGMRFAPVAGEERVAIATDVGNIHVLDMAGVDKGKSRFQFLMNSATTAPLTVVTRDDNEYLLAACDNNRLFCIDLKTDGAMKWTIPMSRPVAQPLSAVGDDVFVVSQDGELRKYSLQTGEPVMVSRGAQAIVSQTEGVTGKLPAYGAVVDFRASGNLAFQPIRVANRSTGQTVNSLIIDLSSSGYAISFSANELNEPLIQFVEESGEVTGVKSMTLSPDRRLLTIQFSHFDPEEVLSFHAEFEHPEIPNWKLTDRHLVGGKLKALVSPLRSAIAAKSSLVGFSESFPPRTIVGRISENSTPWSIQRVKSLVSISENAVYFVDINDRLVSVNRSTASNPIVTPVREYSIHLNNRLTDRVYLSTASGRVACFTETRIELGVLPLPSAGCLTWLLYPKAELSPEFAAYHQNPGRRPLMPDVPKSDAPLPAAEGADGK
jgi:outer membrane protein assembly factor BamB